ncbi:hypothetical protein DICA1_E30482 [Diutina catenulata]
MPQVNFADPLSAPSDLCLTPDQVARLQDQLSELFALLLGEETNVVLPNQQVLVAVVEAARDASRRQTDDHLRQLAELRASDSALQRENHELLAVRDRLELRQAVWQSLPPESRESPEAIAEYTARVRRDTLRYQRTASSSSSRGTGQGVRGSRSSQVARSSGSSQVARSSGSTWAHQPATATSGSQTPSQTHNCPFLSPELGRQLTHYARYNELEGPVDPEAICYHWALRHDSFKLTASSVFSSMAPVLTPAEIDRFRALYARVDSSSITKRDVHAMRDMLVGWVAELAANSDAYRLALD